MYNNINNNKNHWIRKDEESDFSEDSWSNTYSTETDSSYLYVNNMNEKNNNMKSREIILAGLQSVIDMCTPTESVSDAGKSHFTNEGVIDCVEKEFTLLEEEFKKNTTADDKKNISNRRDMLKGIRNLVERKSQLDMENGVLHTVQGTNEVMIMSFIRPEIVSVNHNRLRAGARESSSRSVYSKYSQTHGLNKPEKGDSKTDHHQTKSNRGGDHKNASNHNINKHAPDTLYTTSNKFLNSTSSSMQSKDFFSSFSGSNSTGTKFSDTDNDAKMEIKNLKDYHYNICSSCAENDALPLNAKVSTISTNNLKVIHISLGANAACKQRPADPVCFKCLKNKKTCKKKAPKLCLNAFASITGKPAADANVIKESDHNERKSDTRVSHSKAGSTRKSSKTYVKGSERKSYNVDQEEKELFCQPQLPHLNKTKEQEYFVKSGLSENRSDGISTESTSSQVSAVHLKKHHKKSHSKHSANRYRSTSSSKTNDTIYLIECEKAKGSNANLKCDNSRSDTKSSSKHSQSSQVNDDSDTSKKSINKMAGDGLMTNQKRTNRPSSEGRKPNKDLNGQIALKEGITASEEDLRKQKAALESIKELSENITNEFSVSTNKTIRVPSNKTIIISNRNALKTYHMETENYLALTKGPQGDNAVLDVKRKSSSRDKSVRRRESKKLSNEEIGKQSLTKKDSLASRKGTFTSLDNFFVTGAIQQQTSPSSDESNWHNDIPQLTKQIHEQLYQSESDEDSMKTHFVQLNVENPDGIDIESEKAVATTECRRKLEKKFTMAQFFGHTPEPCDCQECVKNRPMEIRYATTKISKFQRYSTFEILKSSKYKPKFLSSNTETIFVMKNKNL